MTIVYDKLLKKPLDHNHPVFNQPYQEKNIFYGRSGASADQYTPATKVVAPVGYTNKADFNGGGQAIQDAINAVRLLGGGTVEIKAGTYIANNAINLASNVWLRGEGYATKIVFGASVGFNLVNVSNVIIQSLQTDGTAQVAANKSILLVNVTDISIEDCWILNAGGFGIFTTVEDNNEWGKIRILRNRLSGRGTSDVIGGGPNTVSGIHSEIIIKDNFVAQDSTIGNNYTVAIDIVAQNKTIIQNNITQGSIIVGGENIPHYHVDVSHNDVRPAIGADYCQLSLTSRNNQGKTDQSNYINFIGNHVIQGHILMQGDPTKSAYTSKCLIALNEVEVSTTSVDPELTYGISLSYMQNVTAAINNVSGGVRGISYANINGLNIIANTFENCTTPLQSLGGNSNVRIFANPGYTSDTTLNNFLIEVDSPGNTTTFAVKRVGADNQFVIDTANTRVGIGTGTATLLSLLHLKGQSPTVTFEDSNQTAPAGQYQVVSRNDQLEFYRGILGSTAVEKFEVNTNQITAIALGVKASSFGAFTGSNLIYFPLSGNSYINNGSGLGIGLTSPTALLHLAAGSALANTAPLKFNSGVLLTTSEVGAVEFLTDKFYGTITTGAVRKELALIDAALTSGRVPYVTTNGRLLDSSSFLFDGTILTVSSVALKAGNSSGNIVKVGGSIFDHFVDAGNVTTGETDLYSDTVPASVLNTNGDKLEVEYGGVFVSSGTATREVKVYFGGTVIFDTGALTLSLSAAWTCYITITRVSTTVIRYMISLTTEGAALAAYTAVGELTGLTLSNTNILKVTGQAAGIGAATNDIVAKMGNVIFLPAA